MPHSPSSRNVPSRPPSLTALPGQDAICCILGRIPEIPEAPEVHEVPGAPEVHEIPEAPEVPGAPDTPEAPSHQNTEPSYPLEPSGSFCWTSPSRPEERLLFIASHF